MTDQMYTSAGWVDGARILDDPATFVICLGGRGIGKTFNVLDEILKRRLRWIYMRRTQSQIDACKLPELNPFKALNTETGSDVVVAPLGKYLAGFYHSQLVDGCEKPVGETIGIGVALSTFANIRGVDGSDYDILLFDEFIPERHERNKIREEGLAFLNAVETLSRNRELTGKAPLKCILLSNSNDLNSPILDALGALKPLDEMIRQKKTLRRLSGGAISIRRYMDSPISKKKSLTSLYRAASSTDFAAMSLNNEFSADNYENVRSRPLQEFLPLVSIGEITVYEHKSDATYYIIEGVKAPERFTLLTNDRKSFKRSYWFLYEALLDRRVSYSTAPVKLAFESLWR